MTDTKARETHTPGPWKSHSCAIVNEDGREIAVAFPTVEGGREEGQANARLIAAAPDMNGALEWFLEETRGSISDVEAQRVVGRMRGIATLALGLARGGRS